MRSGGAYEKRRRERIVRTRASNSASTLAARPSPSRASTSTSSSAACHDGAREMSAAISKHRSTGASISTVRSPVITPITPPPHRQG
jgi:hypothetical protein